MHGHLPFRRRRSDGFTVLELAIASTIVVLVFTIIWQAFVQLTVSSLMDMTASDLDASLRRTLNRVTEEVAESGEDTLGVNRVHTHPKNANQTELDYIEFDRRIAFTGDPVADWSSMVTIKLRESAGEIPDNDYDDDSDGLVDEKQLVRIQQGVEDQIILDNIQEIKFVREPWTHFITIEATVQRSVQGSNSDELTLTRQLTRTIALRNRS